MHLFVLKASDPTPFSCILHVFIILVNGSNSNFFHFFFYFTFLFLVFCLSVCLFYFLFFHLSFPQFFLMFFFFLFIYFLILVSSFLISLPFFSLFLFLYYCYYYYYYYHYHYYFFVINIILFIVIIISNGARLWQGLEVWQISSDIKNKRNSGTHEVDENYGNIFIYLYIFCLFIYLFIIF